MQIRSCRPYQKENAIRITGSYRAEGLHKVLYQCPRCLTQQNRITKLAFATEEIYRRSQHRAKALEAVASEKA